MLLLYHIHPNISLLRPRGFGCGASASKKPAVQDNFLYCRFLLCNSIPITVAGGLLFSGLLGMEVPAQRVSIPKTVSGGLQPTSVCRLRQLQSISFNTEDGIGRATTKPSIKRENASARFQYRRRYREGYNADLFDVEMVCEAVSIPKTVSGGLQQLFPTSCRPRSSVSIPKTVSGGLQQLM